MTLTLDELRILTRSMRFKKIRQELDHLSIPYRTLKDGMPLVLVDDFQNLSFKKSPPKQDLQQILNARLSSK